MRRSPELQCESGRPRWDRPDQDCEPQQARDIPRNLQLFETSSDGCRPVRVKVAEFAVSLRGWLRSSDIGCGFEDAGPVRPEECFPVPSLSVVRGGASASPAGREFEIAYVDAESVAQRLALIDAWSVPFEECMPVRGFPSYKGQRNHVGRWWTATTGSLVGYESWAGTGLADACSTSIRTWSALPPSRSGCCGPRRRANHAHTHRTISPARPAAPRW